MDGRIFRHGCAAAVAALGVIAAARADYRGGYEAGPAVFPGSAETSVRGVAVDNNIRSAWYGCVFVGDGGGTDDAPNRRVMIFRPSPASAGTGAAAYTDTGVTISVPNQPGGDRSIFAPFGVFVGEDDTVWVTNYDDRTVETIALPATIPAAGSLGSTTIQIKMSDFDAEAAASSGNANVPAGGSPRGIYVNGPVTNANVFLANYDLKTRAAQRYTVAAPNASTGGVIDHVYTTLIDTQNGPYGIAADPLNRAFVALPSASGRPTMVMVKPNGLPVTGLFPAPDGYSIAAWACVAFVKDASAPNGGYLYYSGRDEVAGEVTVLRYDLAGRYLDGFGSPGGAVIPNFTPMEIGGTITQYLGADDQGNVYQRFQNGSQTAVMKINRHAPFVVDAAAANTTGDFVRSSPTAVDGVVYFGSDDGRLYAYDTATGNPVAGFPVDVSAALPEAVKVQSRAAVYITDPDGEGGAPPTKGIYFNTDRGYICRVNADGTGFAYYAFLRGDHNVSTPAVTPDGTVYVGLSTFWASSVLKLNADMALSGSSLALGAGYTGGTITSVAVDGNNVYVGLQGGTSGDIVVLNAADLTVKASFAKGEGVTAPPFVNGMNAYVGTQSGNFYKVNSATFNPDLDFGKQNAPSTPGHAAIGEALPGSAFNDGATFYVGSDNGKVWQVDGLTGAFNVLYDTGKAGAVIPGVVVNRATNTLAFGADVPGASPEDPHSGVFYQVPTNGTGSPVNAQVFQGYGAFETTPTLDRATGRFFIGSDDKNVYALSSR